MQVAMFGTFDIGNFGDLLFPIVAEHKFRDFGLTQSLRFSYRRKSAAEWCYEVNAIQDFPDRVGNTSLVTIGGGHLIHFNRLMAEGYGPTSSAVPHPLGFWWLPAVAARMSGIPVALNAVSVDTWTPAWASPLMTSFLDALDYVSVRDEKSRERLSRFARSGVEINVVPDSVFSIRDVIERGTRSEECLEFHRVLGLPKEYIVVQPSHGLHRFEREIERLAAMASSRGLAVLELPIGYEMGNPVGFYKSIDGIIRIKDWPSPRLLAEIIANSEAVIGLSLHLSIVAAAFGVPVYRPKYSDGSKYVLLNGLPAIYFLETSPEFRARSDVDVDLSEAIGRRDCLESHWARMAELAKPSACERVIKGWDMLAATPDSFRNASGMNDRWRALRQETLRRRHFFFGRLRNALKGISPSAS